MEWAEEKHTSLGLAVAKLTCHIGRIKSGVVYTILLVASSCTWVTVSVISIG